ncbi:MAG: carotenoid biosynthesis protein [Candidatus Lernaella stagnicola]|nr:carotenoid biosynthesis protein [Candidatus Lernaella stagnicola]
MVVFQLVCLVFLPVAYWLLYRVDHDVLHVSPMIFLAAWLGEAGSIAFYDFYHYNPQWWLSVGEVPVMIPLIWPLVILSARAVGRALFPERARWLPVIVAVVVFFDAAMVEVAAVNTGLWSWAEPGMLGVPLAGVVGWALFAGIVTALLAKLRGLWRWAIVGAAPVLLHGLLIGSWWLLLKWTLRGDWFWLFAGVTVALAVVALRVRGRQRMGMDLALPRLIAAGIFVGMVLLANEGGWPVWRHIAMTSIPYALVTQFQRKILAGKPI